MIRPARPEDAAPVAEIWNHYIRETTVTFLPNEKTPDQVADVLSRETAFVHLEDGDVAGFARAFPFRSGAGYRFTCEHTILLAPGRGGRGIGRALINSLETALREQGKHSLIGVVSGENAAALAFHRRAGFTEVARLPEVGVKFGRWHDAVLMQKFL